MHAQLPGHCLIHGIRKLKSFDKFVLSGAYCSKIYTVPPGLNCPANISPTDVVVVDGPEITKLLRWSTCVLVCFTWLGCWITWIISSWEEKNSRYKFSKFTKWQLFSLKFHPGPFWVKTVVILWICLACNNSFFLLILRWNTRFNSQVKQTRTHEGHLKSKRIWQILLEHWQIYKVRPCLYQTILTIKFASQIYRFILLV